MLNRNFSSPTATSQLFFGRASAVAAGIAALALATASGLVRCPFALWLHVPCPACGSKRSVMALLTGHFRWDLVPNPLAPLAAILLGVLAVRVVLLVAVEGNVRSLGHGRFGQALARALFVVATLEIALWALRWFGLFGGPVPV